MKLDQESEGLRLAKVSALVLRLMATSTGAGGRFGNWQAVGCRACRLKGLEKKN